MKPKSIAIVGAAETTRLGVIPEMSQIQLHADAALNAMADAVSTAAHPASRNGWQLGLSPGDVQQLKMADGVLSLDCEPSR